MFGCLQRQLIPVKPWLQGVVVVTEGVAEGMITLAVGEAVVTVVEVCSAVVEKERMKG